MFQLITVNLSGNVRSTKLGGREYLVAPITLIVPGVLNGSQGPLFYPSEELAKDPSCWDGIPIVIYHPVANGNPVSAKEVEDEHIGVVSHPRIRKDRLVAEGWFDVERTRERDPRVLSSLQRGVPIELSTGLLADQVPQAGEFNGVPYKAIATNYRPDHLAILPDLEGACSIRDGCGVLMNQGWMEYFNSDRGTTMSKYNEAQRKEIVDSLIANCDCWDENDREVLNKVSDEKLEALQKHVAAVVHNRAVAEAARKGFEHGDVGFTFNEKDLKFEASKEPEKQTKEPPVTNQQKSVEPAKPKTAKEWLAEAPPEIQSVVRNAMATEQRQREALVEKITSNQANIFSKEYLLTRPLDELEGIAALAAQAPAEPLYTGASVPALNRRATDYDETDFLPLPGSLREQQKTA